MIVTTISGANYSWVFATRFLYLTESVWRTETDRCAQQTDDPGEFTGFDRVREDRMKRPEYNRTNEQEKQVKDVKTSSRKKWTYSLHNSQV